MAGEGVEPKVSVVPSSLLDQSFTVPLDETTKHNSEPKVEGNQNCIVRISSSSSHFSALGCFRSGGEVFDFPHSFLKLSSEEEECRPRGRLNLPPRRHTQRGTSSAVLELLQRSRACRVDLANSQRCRPVRSLAKSTLQELCSTPAGSSAAASLQALYRTSFLIGSESPLRGSCERLCLLLKGVHSTCIDLRVLPRATTDVSLSPCGRLDRMLPQFARRRLLESFSPCRFLLGTLIALHLNYPVSNKLLAGSSL